MQHLIILFLATIYATSAVYCADTKIRFDNYHVYQLNPQNRRQLEAIKELESDPDSFIFLDGVHQVNSKIKVIVAPHSLSQFGQSLGKNSIPYNLLDTNAQASLQDDIVADANRRTSDYSWREYHLLNDTYNWLYSLENKYNEVTVFAAGRSYEGREILVIKISYGPGRKSIFLEGGMHAREWISPATVTYIANQLLTSQDIEVRKIAESYDWYILPHANPDGYVYSHTTNRAWRKTRTPYGNCYGADPNRNWAVHWNEVGASNNPCSDTYAGPYAFSEIEAKSLSEYIMNNLKDEIFLYLSFHSYSQLLLYPYGYTNKLPINIKEYNKIFNASVDAIGKRYGTKYIGGNIYDAIYPASGSTIDFAVDFADAKYAFCYELRPSRKSLWTGFKLPANQIIPTAEETMDSLIAMIKEAGAEHLL